MSVARAIAPIQTLHHVGFVVPSIEKAALRFASSIQAEFSGEIWHDPVQMVRVAFLHLPGTIGQFLELVEPASPIAPVARFLKQGGGMHHLCFTVSDMSSALAHARAERMVVVQAPVPAVAFDGRLIAWCFTRDKLLIEFLEAESA